MRLSKNRILPYLLLSITIILAIISVSCTYSIVSKVNQTEMTENIYVNDTFSHPIEDISRLLDHNVTGLVYVGRDSCPECLTFNWIMQEEILKKYPLIIIQKFDTSVRAEHDQYQNILDIYEITSIPAVIFLRGDGTYEKILMENMSGQEIVHKMLSLIESEELCY